MLQLILASPFNFLKKAAKTFPLSFSMEHLLHRLYGVDAPVRTDSDGNIELNSLWHAQPVKTDQRVGGVVRSTEMIRQSCSRIQCKLRCQNATGTI